MLGYLQSNSSPEFAYAVSSTARFTHNLRRSHEEALKRIGRYLKAQSTKAWFFALPRL
jgi:hypothetical protein